MYRHILAAVNEHSNSEWAARYALELARVCGARLSLVFAAPPGCGRELVHRAETALERLFVKAAGQGLTVESIVKAGAPFQAIRELGRELAVDLCVAASRREDVSRRFFQKTLGRELLLKLPCSVALIRVVHPGRLHPRRLLVPWRGRLSRLAERAGFVARLAEAFGATVTLFHAPRVLTGFLHGDRRLPPEDREASAIRDMQKFIDCLAAARISLDRRRGRGPLAAAITTEATVSRSDLIVMGASERGLVASVLWGNPVEEVLRTTPCNLIIFLPRGPVA